MISSRRINYVKFFSSLIFIISFVFFIVNGSNFSSQDEKISIDESFMQTAEWETSEININSVAVQLDDDGGVLKYTVQSGDTLLRIAENFWTTTTNIKSDNNLTSEIYPGQVLIIKNDDEWILYPLEEKTNVTVFVNKYNLNLQDIMTLNYIQDEKDILYPGQEIFINITKEKAYEIWLLEKPKPIPVVPNNNWYKPIIKKNTWTSKPNKNQTITIKKPTWWSAGSISSSDKKSGIISKWYYKKDIKNSFYPWYCTWYAAIKMPGIFPYTDENTQSRTFWWNANQRCSAAKEAWFKIWTKPAAWALIVYSRWWRLVQAGHVWVVNKYLPDEWKMIIEDMNYLWKFVVTQRRESVDEWNIKCYIYPWK